MLDEFRAKQFGRRVGGAQALGRIPQGRWQEPGGVDRLLVGVAGNRRIGLDAVLDPPQPRSDCSRQCDIWIDVGGANPVLDAL